MMNLCFRNSERIFLCLNLGFDIVLGNYCKWHHIFDKKFFKIIYNHDSQKSKSQL